MMQTLELKFEDEFSNINDLVARKANAEDLAYLRHEHTFKADKEAFNELRNELLDRI